MSRLSRLITLATVIVALVAAFAVNVPSAFAASKLVYDDEFNTLDSSMWQKANPWGLLEAPAELEYYSADDVQYTGGYCNLVAEKRTMDGHSYTSGIISSLNHAQFTYGYFEMRAKLPTGPGIWPAFWLVGDGLEIDALEMLGDKPSRIYMTLHQGDSQVYQGIKDGPDYSAGFHTYAVDWQPTYIHWFIDGVQVASYDHATPAIPQTICFNNAVGGAWPGSPTSATKFPTTFSIDYLRVYDTKPAADTAPVAADDAYSATSNTTLRVAASGVLANDTDAEGDALSASLVSGPSHGSVSLNSDGSFTYTPASGFWGVDTFTYHVSDGSLSSGNAQVSISVAAANRPRPVATADAYAMLGNSTLTVGAPGVVQNDSSDTSATLTAVVAERPEHGTVEMAADGSFTYTPVTGFSGTDTFSYVADDGEAVSDAAPVVVTVNAPTVVAKPRVTHRSGRTYSISGIIRFGASIKSTSSVGADASTIVMRVRIDRLIHGTWKRYNTLCIVNPSARYAAKTSLRKGTFRVQTTVSGAVPTATSPWSSSFRVR